jgi:hypothetical protein
MTDNEKRLFRERKRELKRLGNRQRRNYLKTRLRINPSEAQWDEFAFGDLSTEKMNGKYPDTKRNKRIDFDADEDE